MKQKNIIITANACLQTLFAIGFFVGLFLAHGFDDPDWGFIPLFCFFAFAFVQVSGAIIIYYLYRKERVKSYLQSVFFAQVLGSGAMFLLGMTDIELLDGLAGLFFFLAWMIIPIFQAMWCWILGWELVAELSKVDEFV